MVDNLYVRQLIFLYVEYVLIYIWHNILIEFSSSTLDWSSTSNFFLNWALRRIEQGGLLFILSSISRVHTWSRGSTKPCLMKTHSVLLIIGIISLPVLISCNRWSVSFFNFKPEYVVISLLFALILSIDPRSTKICKWFCLLVCFIDAIIADILIFPIIPVATWP